jgi:hypothetical protein
VRVLLLIIIAVIVRSFCMDPSRPSVYMHVSCLNALWIIDCRKLRDTVHSAIANRVDWGADHSLRSIGLDRVPLLFEIISANLKTIIEAR